MKARIWWPFILILVLVKPALAANLLGGWSCQGEAGITSLEFVSADRMRFEGEASYYTLLDKVIRIHSQDGDTDYPYSVADGVLKIDFPDGSKLVCRHSKAGGEKLWSLQGRYCSTAAGKGPSWLAFNGRGGLHSSLDKGGPTSDPGSYTVHGDQLSVVYAGGDKASGMVKARSDDGHVSGVEVGKRLYSTGLCH